ncbi:uncharacterized protein RJT20DRAFT_14318 [Scheffersomyces xylosifermentans]|uniref:uncharacterized protein n=1 Tax=Scheffersomyces xylosifermentans TaxID=1304137 RepID=UPI00315C5F55
MSVETRNGLLTKLGIFGVVAVSLFVVGKKHIASYKDERHKRETDARIDSDTEEFGVTARRPGFPINNPTLNYDANARDSKYRGAGNSYSSRRPGDRLSMFAVFDRNWTSTNNNNDNSVYYKPSKDKD